MDDLDLPIQVVYGKIGKNLIYKILWTIFYFFFVLGQLVLKIPWKSLYSSPTVICIEDIFILVEPNQQVKYDAAKEEKQLYESKKKEIEKVEAAKKAEAEKGNLMINDPKYSKTSW